jgi:predicted Zn finger-like uncharacterized protein
MGLLRQCKECHTVFTVEDSKVRVGFCSDRCKKDHRNAKLQYKRLHPEEATKKCRVCNRNFVILMNDSPRKTCSEECREKDIVNMNRLRASKNCRLHKNYNLQGFERYK